MERFYQFFARFGSLVGHQFVILPIIGQMSE